MADLGGSGGGMSEIEKGNRLIAEFMGAVWIFQEQIYHSYGWYYERDNTPTKHSSLWHGDESLQYHSSWDWLMPVVEKIEKLGYGFTVDPWGIEIIDYKTGNEEVRVKFENDDNYPKIQQYYDSVIQFILWYNTSQHTEVKK